jgi:hypothetical protein
MGKIREFLRVVSDTTARVVNFVLLFFVYFLGVGLTSVIGKIFRKRFLDMNYEKVSWTKREKIKDNIRDYEHTF